MVQSFHMNIKKILNAQKDAKNARGPKQQLVDYGQKIINRHSNIFFLKGEELAMFGGC